MGELELPKKPEPIYIKVPHPECEVPDCINPRKYDMLYILLNERHIDVVQVCMHHKFLWDGQNFFPLNQAPSLEWVQHYVVQEYARRYPPVQQTYVRYMNVTTTMNFGGTGGYFRG